MILHWKVLSNGEGAHSLMQSTTVCCR